MYEGVLKVYILFCMDKSDTFSRLLQWLTAWTTVEARCKRKVELLSSSNTNADWSPESMASRTYRTAVADKPSQLTKVDAIM